jgi:DNA-binding transcriptional MerR regulator
VEGLTIGQLAKRAGVGVETIRFYERQGLLPKPPRAASGYRQYPRDAVTRMRFIARAKDLLFTLDEIKHLLALHDGPAGTRAEVRQWVERKAEELDRQAQSLHAAQEALRRLRESCAGDGPASGCPILLALADEPGGETPLCCPQDTTPVH